MSSPHRRWKGHCLLCVSCSNQPRIKGNGRRKYPTPVARQLGKSRRYSKHIDFRETA